MTRPARTPISMRFAMLAALATSAAVFAACGGGGTPTIAVATQAPAGTSGPAATTSLGGTVDTTAVCRDLTNLKSLDYAFGASFSVIKSLDAGAMALTLQHLQTFAAEAPPELQGAVADLIAVWTQLAADPNSVTESDPRIASATQKLTDWLTANCG
jgi:hypothetical protein